MIDKLVLESRDYTKDNWRKSVYRRLSDERVFHVAIPSMLPPGLYHPVGWNEAAEFSMLVLLGAIVVESPGEAP